MTPIRKPITRELALRYLNYPEKDYVAEISADGIRFRKKGTRTWFAVVPWHVILEKSVAIQSRANLIESSRKKATRRTG